MIAAAALAWAVSCSAAPPVKLGKDTAAAPTGYREAGRTDLLAEAPIDWTKTYSLAPYREFWTLEVAVKDYNKDLPKVISLLEKSGAQAVLPPAQSAHGETLKSQQLSYRLPEKSGRDFLKKLGRLGAVGAPRITHSGEPINLAEVDEKLARLSAERGAHPRELAAMPSVAALVDEMVQHLSAVKRVRESVETQVTLNITVREKS